MESKQDEKRTSSVVVFAINIYLQLIVNLIEDERKDLMFLEEVCVVPSAEMKFFLCLSICL